MPSALHKTPTPPCSERGSASTAGGTARKPDPRAYRLQLVLEENAKWGLAADVLREIRDIYASRVRETQSSFSPKLPRQDSKKRAKTSAESADERKSGSGVSKNPDGSGAGRGKAMMGSAGGARILVLVRDEHTCSQLRQHWALGGSLMMRKRFFE